MKILALNCGSSSVKYKLFDTELDYQLLVKGIAERIGHKSSLVNQITANKQEIKIEEFLPDHRAALQKLYQTFFKDESSLIADVGVIDGVGHRITHGGEKFKNSTLIDENVMDTMKKAAKFAPLHSQPNIMGIEVCRELLSAVPHVAVFDTTVHQTIEPKAYLYGLPIEYYDKYGIRKYGFHGINHGYVAQKAAKVLNKPLEDLKIITCHLGNGCSVTAFARGSSVDTSMGLTPLEGLVMGTRCGDIDPSVILHLIEVLGLKPSKVSEMLNRKSGLLGLCGTNDMRDIIEMAQKKDKHAQIAIEVFVYRTQKYIGAFTAALNGVNAIVFTGGIGEKSSYIRQCVVANFGYLGAKIDLTKNENSETVFSTADSDVCLMNIPANEELVIAQETYKVISKKLKK